VAILFLDTSALVRRYDISEPGASTVEVVCAPSSGNVILLAQLTSVEMASAFSRKTRDGSLSAQTVEHLWALFKIDWQRQYQIVTLTDAIYALAERLIFGHPLRSFDAVQVASARIAAESLPQPDLEFWTADRRQAQVGAAEGLSVQLVG
jgi:uncharacterized protein